jgi:hypothetical protein
MRGLGLREHALEHPGHFVPQQHPPAAQPLFDRFLGQAEGIRHRADRLVFPIKQHQRLAVRVRQLVQRAPQQGFFLVRAGQIARCRVGRRKLLFLAHEGGRPLPTGLAAHVIQRQLPRDAADPGTEPFRFPQPLELAPGGYKSLLGNVFAGIEITADRIRHAAGGGTVTGDEVAEGMPVATGGRRDQVGVERFRRFEDWVHNSKWSRATER